MVKGVKRSRCWTYSWYRHFVRTNFSCKSQTLNRSSLGILLNLRSFWSSKHQCSKPKTRSRHPHSGKAFVRGESLPATLPVQIEARSSSFHFQSHLSSAYSPPLFKVEVTRHGTHDSEETKEYWEGRSRGVTCKEKQKRVADTQQGKVHTHGLNTF